MGFAGQTVKSLFSVLRRAAYVAPIVLVVNENVVSLCGVEGRSMQPTLNPVPAPSAWATSAWVDASSAPSRPLFLDRVLLDRLSARYSTFDRGDVVVLRSPTDPDAHLIKRLVAMPGDWMRISSRTPLPFLPESSFLPELAAHPRDAAVDFSGSVSLQGSLRGEPGGVEGYRELLVIPKGQCWVEGDNADLSYDSRSFGPVPLALIEGRVTHVVWPPHRMGSVQRKDPPGRIVRKSTGPAF